MLPYQEEMIDEVINWLYKGGPRPKIKESDFFEVLFCISEGEMPGTFIQAVRRAGMSEKQISKFKNWWLQKGLDEGWLKSHYFGLT